MLTPPINDATVISNRPPKNRLDPWKPYLVLQELEYSAQERAEEVLTIFLTNKECPFRCTICDLWLNTLNVRVPIGGIPAQIKEGCSQYSQARHIKLYNAGNFFDPQAIPPEDHGEIARLVHPFETVIVENHPRMTDARCVRFRDMIDTNLEIALGLETIHPQVLLDLNKRMTVEHFDRAAQFLVRHQIAVRVFLLLKPPGMTEEQGLEWMMRSVQHAINVGATCISMIPTRAGNGIMERLQSAGQFSPPTLRSMELALERGIEYARQISPKPRVFMDLWDSARFFDCPDCGPQRVMRMEQMNLTQQTQPPVLCSNCKH